ncbi:ATP-binding cassette domain-containing protein [Pontibacterium granulatum]|uniref:ATP-binding cassette domain-containing protein n=1 Tax=Pontibacterium granulatum TaxID=2036029 RepID=UPI00249C5FE3|nr:ATP-binding cassette domain-containing protein [Pontibacterium granulatum]MDI3323530.1 ATP-binding cassette domain-containing protein [Pontibacterium granulatum]
MLEINNLVIQRDGQALHYQLAVAEGEILAIQGRSGVGKSTLLGALAGFVDTESGDMRWQGQSLLPLAADQRPVSMLFQDHNLFEHLSALDNMQLGFPGLAPKEELLEAAKALDVDELLQKKPTELSGGQRQRIAIIRTLLRPEPIVLLDEPFAELDQHTRHQAADWVKRTAKQAGKTVLLVTHQQEDVTQLADRLLVL